MAITLPNEDDYDGDFEEFQEHMVNTMMSGKLSKEQLKEGFQKFVESIDYDWQWMPARLFQSPPDDLWRIHKNRLQFHHKMLFDPDLPNERWIHIRAVHDQDLIAQIGRYFNKLDHKETIYVTYHD